MLAAPVAGFRGPAKRAAFGDVTNVSKGLMSSARDDPKSSLKTSSAVTSTLPPQAVTAVTSATSTTKAKQSHILASQNKENAPFSNPAATTTITTTTTSITTTISSSASSSTTAAAASSTINSKETHPLSRPAQRTAAPSSNHASKSKNSLPESQDQHYQYKQPDAARRPVTAGVVQDTSANLCNFNFDIPNQQHEKKPPLQQQARSTNAVSNRAMPASQGPADAPPRQLRHHKSQPQLKQQRSQQQLQQQQQQSTLRSLQRKPEKNGDHQHDLPDRPDSHSTRRTSIGSSSMAAATMCEEASSDPAYLASLCISVDTESRAPSDSENSDDFVDLPAKLPNISEEPASDISFKDYPALSFSEAEEGWDYEDEDEDEDNDDDDDDYDEQDQAYTTNYSTKTRDLTTVNVTTMLAPRVNARVQLELDNARLEVERTRPPEDIEEEAWDVSMVAEYGDEIFAYMRELEIQMSPNPDYMDIQSEIQWSMRSVLMDWVVQVHNRFNLLPETLFLTVNYIDRFLSCKVVSIGKLQLVGATAILVASKYEEINCPSLEEIVYMVDGGYTTEEVLKAERFMLSMLSFELGWPGPMSFLRRVSKADDYDLETRTLAKYFLELTIMDERFVASPPSFVAAGAHCLSRLILNKGLWTKHHVHYSGYTWSQLKSLITMMIECCENPKQHHSAIFDKYQEKRFRGASLLVQQALDAGFTLPHHSRPVRRPAAQPSLLNGVLDQPRTGVFLPV